MKTLLTFILLPLLSFGQSKNNSESPESQDSIKSGFLFVKNSEVLFQKIYPSDLSKEQLLLKVKSFLPTVKAFDFKESLGQSDDQLSGTLRNFYVNVRRHKNASLFNFSNLLGSPLNAEVHIQLKDFKYRVTISGIYFLLDSGKTTLDQAVLKTLSAKFKDFENVTKILSQDLDWEFDIAKNNKISSDF